MHKANDFILLHITLLLNADKFCTRTQPVSLPETTSFCITELDADDCWRSSTLDIPQPHGLFPGQRIRPACRRGLSPYLFVGRSMYILILKTTSTTGDRRDEPGSEGHSESMDYRRKTGEECFVEMMRTGNLLFLFRLFPFD